MLLLLLLLGNGAVSNAIRAAEQNKTIFLCKSLWHDGTDLVARHISLTTPKHTVVEPAMQ